MGFGERIANGWALTQQSLRVLMLDKELLVFPLLSSLAAIVVTASFAFPLWSSGYIESLAESEGAPNDPSVYVLLFLFYFVNYAVMIFFNAAIVSCALKRLRGGDPTVAFGLQSAMGLLPQILAWSLLSATVGFVLRMIENKAEGLGRLVVGLIGVATHRCAEEFGGDPAPQLGRGPGFAHRHGIHRLRRGAALVLAGCARHRDGEQLHGHRRYRRIGRAVSSGDGGLDRVAGDHGDGALRVRHRRQRPLGVRRTAAEWRLRAQEESALAKLTRPGPPNRRGSRRLANRNGPPRAGFECRAPVSGVPNRGQLPVAFF